MYMCECGKGEHVVYSEDEWGKLREKMPDGARKHYSIMNKECVERSPKPIAKILAETEHMVLVLESF